MTFYPLKALRTLALYTQSLHAANTYYSGPDCRNLSGSELNGATTSSDTIQRTIEQIGCLQIDTLHMVRRSHYLALWSRLGTYDPTVLDSLLFGPQRCLFEGWQHAASIIPLSEYRYQMPHQRNLREHPNSWYNDWLKSQVDQDFVP